MNSFPITDVYLRKMDSGKPANFHLVFYGLPGGKVVTDKKDEVYAALCRRNLGSHYFSSIYAILERRA